MPPPLPFSYSVDFSAPLALFSETKGRERYSQTPIPDPYHDEATRSVIVSVNQIPYWIYGVFIVRRRNEYPMVRCVSPSYSELLYIT
jgi:hypothetical protein